jgi:hypothetical protein
MVHRHRGNTEYCHSVIKIKFLITPFCTEVDLVDFAAAGTYRYIWGGVLSNKGGVRINAPRARFGA